MTTTSSHTAHTAYLGVRFFGSLDGLRFLCIAAVLWHHSPAFGSLEDPATLLRRGFLGVNFFFVLSGFLITTLLLREEARAGRFSLSGFYRRRILRIVPVYFLVVTAVAGYYVLVQGRDDLAPLVPYYYLFLSNFLIEDIPLLSITWSLAVEEQYYLVWPLLLLLMPAAGRTRWVVLTALVLVCLASAEGWLSFLGLRPIETEHAIWRLPAGPYMAILFGSLTAVVLHGPRGYAVAHALCGHHFAPVVMFLLLAAFLSVAPGDLQGWPLFVIHSIMALCIVSIVVREDHVLAGALAARPLVRIGQISYGLYLYHLIGLHIAREGLEALGFDAGGMPWTVTALFTALSIMISEVSFRTYESYFLRLKSGDAAQPAAQAQWPTRGRLMRRWQNRKPPRGSH